MRILAICPLSKQVLRSDRRRRGGFTLLELLIVLVLFAMLAGLALPRVATLYDSFSEAHERDEALRALAELGFVAYRQGLSFDLEEYPPQNNRNDVPLTLPAGWSIRAKQAVHYRDNGFCSGGELTLSFKGRSIEVIMQPPFCRPELM